MSSLLPMNKSDTQQNDVDESQLSEEDIALSRLLIVSGGDIKMVVDRVNYNKPKDDHINSVDVIQAFLNTASRSTQVQEAVKAEMLLNFLEILRVTKDNLLTELPNFDGPLLLRTFRDVVAAIVSVLPAPAPTIVQNQNNTNILQQFAGDPVRERIEKRLQMINEVAEKYPESLPEDRRIINNDEEADS